MSTNTTTSILFIEGILTTERWQQLEQALGKLGWRGGNFITSQGNGVVSGKWSFELTESAVRQGLTPQQSMILDALESGNRMKCETCKPMARELDALVELGLCGRIVDGATATYFVGNLSLDGSAFVGEGDVDITTGKGTVEIGS